MILSEEEHKLLGELRVRNPLVEKIWNQLKKYEGDEGMEFYASLSERIRDLDKHVKDCDPKEFKRYMLILTNSKKILEGLNQGKKMRDELNNNVEEKTNKKLKAEEVMSFSDLMAETKK
jgi:hypothetical protein